MSAFTLRINPTLSKELDRYCRDNGFKKTGLILMLLKNFLREKRGRPVPPPTEGKKSLSDLVGIVSLGGDSVKDSDAYFE